MTTSTEYKKDSILYFIFNDEPFNPERIGGPTMPVAVLIGYFIFVKILGPLLMKNIKPFQLKTTMIVFNFSLVIFNMYISFHLFRIMVEGWRELGPCAWDYADPATPAYTVKSFKYIWLYYLSKYVDLIDTVIFVLRKKQNQITFLHVFHHMAMISLIWYSIYWGGTGSVMSLGFGMNAFVHVVMYGYYGIAACGPKMQKYISPYKKYLTLTQLAQFVIAEIYILSCATNPHKTRYTWMFFIFALIILFTNFYIKTYSKIKKK